MEKQNDNVRLNGDRIPINSDDVNSRRLHSDLWVAAEKACSLFLEIQSSREKWVPKAEEKLTKTD